MKPRQYLAALGAAVVIATAVSCGDVPTYTNGVAYITAIQLPAPAIEAASLLRDSTGTVAKLRVQAFDQAGNEILGQPVTYVVLTPPARLIFAADGTTTAMDTVMSLQVVARVGATLQTPPVTLPIVPHPTALSRVGLDTAVTLPVLQPLPLTVTGTWHSTALPVFGVIVRYAISAVYPSSRAGSVVLTAAVDTTDVSGNTSHAHVAVDVGVDSVFVVATAKDFGGNVLPGSPQTFVLRASPKGP